MLRYPGLSPVLVSIAFPLSPSISRCLSIHSSPAIGFLYMYILHSQRRHCSNRFGSGSLVVLLLYDKRICTYSIDPSLSDGEFPGLGLDLVPDVVVPEAEHGVRMKQKSRFKFLPGRGLNLEPRNLMAAEFTTRLPEPNRLLQCRL